MLEFSPNSITLFFTTKTQDTMAKSTNFIRQTLMYYIDIYSFCENPEKAWVENINYSNSSPPEPTLFD